LRRSAILPCHGNIDACLINENASVRIHLTHFLWMEATLFLDLFTGTLCGVIRRFFRVSFNRARVRCLPDRLGVT
jgi:hypothetical protein